MHWYIVIKTIGGKPYLYRQRTYREGGKVRTRCHYLGPASDTEGYYRKYGEDVPVTITDNFDNIDDSFKSANAKIGTISINWPNNKPVPKPGRQVSNLIFLDKADKVLTLCKISKVALEAEYLRTKKHLTKKGIKTGRLRQIRIATGDTKNNRTTRKTLRQQKRPARSTIQPRTLTLHNTLDGMSSRNPFKKNYRIALAHDWLDSIESQRPFLFDQLRSQIDASWLQTKWLVTKGIFGSKEPHKLLWAIHFLWSNQMPPHLEKKFASLNTGYVGRLNNSGAAITSEQKRSIDQKSVQHPTWSDEAADLVAHVIQRGYHPALQYFGKEQKKAASNAQRNFKLYQKMDLSVRLGKKGRNTWNRYKLYEVTSLNHQRRTSTLKMLAPFLDDFHK